MTYTKQWQVYFSAKAAKQIERLTTPLLASLRLLVEDLMTKGPTVGGEWPNYSKLHGKPTEDRRHCHLKKGRPTYVCCWEVMDKKIKIIEVYYVGTHENAPY